jgi:GAF domain-containing protein
MVNEKMPTSEMIAAAAERQRQLDEIRAQDARWKAARAQRRLTLAEYQSVSTEIVNAGLKSLAKQYHPDKTGGSSESMSRINAARDWLLARIQSALL